MVAPRRPAVVTFAAPAEAIGQTSAVDDDDEPSGLSRSDLMSALAAAIVTEIRNEFLSRDGFCDRLTPSHVRLFLARHVSLPQDS
jgi:hypothetical protein